MKRFLLPVLVVGAMALTVGCATKNYVTKQATPLINKIDQLDDRTAQTTRGIHDTDQRAQQGIQSSGRQSRRGRPEGAGRRSAGRSGAATRLQRQYRSQ